MFPREQCYGCNYTTLQYYIGYSTAAFEFHRLPLIILPTYTLFSSLHALQTIVNTSYKQLTNNNPPYPSPPYMRRQASTKQLATSLWKRISRTEIHLPHAHIRRKKTCCRRCLPEFSLAFALIVLHVCSIFESRVLSPEQVHHHLRGEGVFGKRGFWFWDFGFHCHLLFSIGE
jgi:hypothetical protein